MFYTLFNVFYVLVAIAMTALILMQQGAGANAGAAFGSGASGTVFGARGSANFMSKSTAVLAAIFFLMSLGMAVYMHKAAGPASIADDLGVMGSAAVTTEQQDAAPIISEVPQTTTAPDASTEVPAAPAEPAEPAEPAPVEEPASE